MGGWSNQNEYLSQYQACAAQQQSLSGLSGFWGSLLGSFGGTGVSTPGPDKDGWYDYYYTVPDPNVLCQFKYYEDGIPWIGYDDFSPETNIGYLKWRLTGIARVQLEEW